LFEKNYLFKVLWLSTQYFQNGPAYLGTDGSYGVKRFIALDSVDEFVGNLVTANVSPKTRSARQSAAVTLFCRTKSTFFGN